MFLKLNINSEILLELHDTNYEIIIPDTQEVYTDLNVVIDTMFCSLCTI